MPRKSMNTLDQTRELLRHTLNLGERADQLTAESPLLGSLPEFDSMAIVGLVAAMEEQLGVEVDDEDITAEVFETVGSLSGFIEARL